jgi:beta-N-acetylhexosaminidase
VRPRSKRQIFGLSTLLVVAAAAGVVSGILAGVALLAWSLFQSAGHSQTSSVRKSALAAGARAPTPTPVSFSIPVTLLTPRPTPRQVAVTPSPTSVPTTPQIATATQVTRPAASTRTLTLEQAAGQLVVAGFAGTNAEGAIVALVSDKHVGNVILQGQNVQNPLQLRELTDGLQRAAKNANSAGLIVAFDHEGGDAAALHPPFFSRLPSAADLTAIGDAAQVTASAQRSAKEMATAGINLELAPVLDVGDPPRSRGVTFGGDPDVVTQYGLAFMKGMISAGVAVGVKHFPGQGRATQDPSVALPFVNMNETFLRGTALPPFEAAIAGGAGVVIVSHAVYPAWDPARPASLSKRIVTDVLRGELGYQGVVMTDDLSLAAIRGQYPPGEAAVLAIEAGSDLVLVTAPSAAAEVVDALTAAVQSRRISRSRLDESVARIIALKRRLGVATPP